MDISSFPRPFASIEWPVLQAWLLRAHHDVVFSQLNWDAQWLESLDVHRPDAQFSSADVLAWLKEHGLVEDAGHGLSMKGVSLTVSPEHRSKKEPAWESAARLLARVAWVNGADSTMVGMRVADVLLFGSMANPAQKTYGDLDAVLVFEPLASRPAQEAAFDAAGWTFDCVTPGFRSFRRLLECQLSDGDKFLSLTSQSTALSVLLDQDPSFACYSLLGRLWTSEQLAHTTADEDAFAVVQALANGHDQPAARAHVARELRAARSRLGLDGSSASLAALAQPSLPSQASRQQTIWWSSLQTGGAQALLKRVADSGEPVEAWISEAAQSLASVLPERVAEWSSRGFKPLSLSGKRPPRP